MSKDIYQISITKIKWTRIFSGIRKWIVLSLIIIVISGCGQSPNIVAPTSTPKFDPKQSGNDLMNMAISFSYLTNKMAEKYQVGEIDFIDQNLSDLEKIAHSTDQLVISTNYNEAKTYLSKMMWSQISFYSAIKENHSVELNSLIPIAQEGTAYYNLFVIEMKNLGHDLITE